MTKKKKILVLILYVFLILIFLFCLKFKIPCLSKTIFHIPCPACGLTRAFKCILKLQIISSFHYSIIGLPLFLIFLIILIVDIFDLIFKKEHLTKILKFITNHYFLIIIILLFSWFINLYRGI